MADNMSIDNKPPPPPNSNELADDYDESLDSSPEDEHDHLGSAPAGNNPATAGNSNTQDGQQPKRKGGRKPVS